MKVFDYLNCINEKREAEHLRDYNPYLTNHSLSYSLDTVLLANEMNRYPNLPPEAQYDFLYETVRRGKRFAKWYKHEENPNVELVMEYYGYSKKKALEALQVLTDDDIKYIKSLKEH